MTILCSGIASDTRVLLSRQHTKFSKEALDSSFSNFLRLIEKKKGDHTFVETDKNCFLYQVVDDFYVFIMTSLDSNIIEDLIVVKTLVEIIQNIVKPVLNEENIINNLFDIIFYMDELISNNKRECLTYDQIKTYIEMESHEEKMHKLIQESKEKEEKERRKEIAAKLEKRKQLDHLFTDHNVSVTATYQPQSLPLQDTCYQQQQYNRAMNLNRMSMTPKLRNVDKKAEVVKKVDTEAPLVVQIIESCNGNIHLDGDVDVLNVQGEVVVTAFEVTAQAASLQIENDKNIKVRYHPMVDKSLTKQLRIQLHNEYNIGQPLSIVKWRYKSEDDDTSPILVNCWPNLNGDGTTTVAVELENNSEEDLSNVTFQILHSRYDLVNVSYNEIGEVQKNIESTNWVIEEFGSKCTSKFEFTINNDINNILPFTLFAQSQHSISKLKIVGCSNKSSKEDGIDHVVKVQTSFSITIGA